MKPDRFGDFLTRFLGASEMLDKATRPVARGSAPPPAGALDEARRHLHELRGEARQLIVQMGEEVTAVAKEPAVPALPILGHGRRPSWWQDTEVAVLVTRLHRQVELRQAISLCQERFGWGRAPSMSSLHRYWTKLDALAREGRR
ncbi:MAG: hypothetical protein DI537_36470 [Stutzerimonas stutzeri]|nr:MAG: hypothetical protein DI537_36470 [Stutzerimonas stutzeri]